VVSISCVVFCAFLFSLLCVVILSARAGEVMFEDDEDVPREISLSKNL